ncbi:unnamed protein product [Caenorhabditis auriculariae]|uniref:Tetratricopeptide repeat protein 7 N-terminal domain-containing protein n=1 Tax=Caenorhabditis auriculariae TaxID=2777116 RepID=A0A8S1HIL4_9PELO|nr:unnamed protein product [Caenorhabditis auriculariae]
MSKLKGSRLEAEVDRARTDGNWKRLTELLPAVRSKHSGLEDVYELLLGEVQLESYLEQQGEILRPNKDHYDKVKGAESQLYTTIREHGKNGSAILEANLLLSKLHYTCAEYQKSLIDIDNSGMENANTPFRTLRALRLVAEAYAIKGLCLETMEVSSRSRSESVGSNTSYEQKALFCFEKSAELAISFINELEKTIFSAQAPKGANVSTSSVTGKPAEKLGEILECCLERVAVLRAKDTIAQKKKMEARGSNGTGESSPASATSQPASDCSKSCRDNSQNSSFAPRSPAIGRSARRSA